MFFNALIFEKYLKRQISMTQNWFEPDLMHNSEWEFFFAISGTEAWLTILEFRIRPQ